MGLDTLLQLHALLALASRPTMAARGGHSACLAAFRAAVLLAVAANMARSVVYAALPSLAPANARLTLLLGLVLLRAALTCLTQGWQVPAEPAAAAAAPWAIPMPRLKPPPRSLVLTLLYLAPACHLACCGRLLADPLLPLSYLYLWLPAAVHLALCALGVLYVQFHEDFAPAHPAGLMDAWAPLGSLLSCARLPAQARLLRATALRLPAEFHGSALHRAFWAALAALDGAAALEGSAAADAQQQTAATPTLDLFEALMAFLLQSAPPQLRPVRQTLFVLLQLLGLLLSLGVAHGLQALASAPWVLQLVALQERDASAALAAAKQWLVAPLFTPLSLLNTAFWTAWLLMLVQRFCSSRADHVLSQACAWALALAAHLPLHLLASAALDAGALVLRPWRLCGAARERSASAAALQRTAARALTFFYLRTAAAARAPVPTLLLLAALDFALQVTAVALLNSGGALTGRMVPPAQGGPGLPRTLATLRAALARAAARGLLGEDCAVCATALGEATPSRLPPRPQPAHAWDYTPPDALQPWARRPGAVCLCSCGHAYHALCLAACEVAQTRAGGSARCPSCRSESYSSVQLEARRVAPAAAAAQPQQPTPPQQQQQPAQGGGAGPRQRRGSVTRRCGHCRGEGHDRRACPHL